LIPYLEFVKENKKVFLAAIEQPNVLKTQEISKYLYDKLLEPILAKYNIPQNERAYRIACYLNGIWAIIAKWIKSDCKDEINFIVRIIMESIGVE